MIYINWKKYHLASAKTNIFISKNYVLGNFSKVNENLKPDENKITLNTEIP